MLYRGFHVKHRHVIFLYTPKLANQATNCGVLPTESTTTGAKQAGHYQYANSIWPACPVLLQHFSEGTDQAQSCISPIVLHLFEILFSWHAAQSGSLLVSQSDSGAQVRVGVIVNRGHSVALPGK